VHSGAQEPHGAAGRRGVDQTSRGGRPRTQRNADI
jgi:hypothetical protein